MTILSYVESQLNELLLPPWLMKFAKITVLQHGKHFFIRLRFQRDHSYRDLHTYKKVYYSSYITESLMHNEVIFNGDVNNQGTAVVRKGDSPNLIQFSSSYPKQKSFLELKLKCEEIKSETSEFGFQRRGSQYINAILFKVSLNEEFKKKVVSSKKVLIQATKNVNSVVSSLNTCSCKHSIESFEYLQSLNWDHNFFDPEGNRCYCSSCFPPDWIDSQMVAGERYIIPRGWMRFGLRTPSVFSKLNNIWEDWCNVFHGTSPEFAHSIIQHKTLLLHGDLTREGVRVGTKCSAEEWGYYYVSPHICYASHPWYSNIRSAKMRNGKKRYVQFVLAIKIKPGSFKKQEETEGGVKKIFDDYTIIPEDEIEWFSKRRGCVLPYGLLIRVFGEKKKKEITRLA